MSGESILLGKTAIVAMCSLLAGCASTGLPTGDQAYAVIPAPSSQAAPSEYRIGPLDILKITVFQEPDLSLEEVPVDASGNILFPLIGQVAVSGKTSTELSNAIADRLGEKYLVDPQVSTIVSTSASQNVTVEGAVNKPGVFPLQGPTTLLQAMALSEGPTQTAKLREVIVFRRKEDGVYAAQFDLGAIRIGQAPNPEILGGDIVVVGNSFAKQLFRDFLQLSPILSTVFVRLSNN
ncbi:polysaccharide export protein [Sphingopyxis indica]|uniref:polysaccharide biosynthesis/export family protein n=1 Tax=Sphingopyxis indica TaxID=436663 RepID=UPI00293925B9|nr:polysaccharide biosynthesis/export family protein [Sphingopyxis indica]WOF44575.1 polysaccharide export protein [Sphingopyxis indica]